MLNTSDKSGHSCLVPDLGGNAFSFSPWKRNAKKKNGCLRRPYK